VSACDRAPRVLVTAGFDWCLVAARFFFETVAGGIPVRTAEDRPDNDDLLHDGWADVLVVVTPTRQERHLSGLQAICMRYPEARVLALSVEHDDGIAERARAAGAHGYLHLESSADDAVETLRTVADGGTAFPLQTLTPPDELPPVVPPRLDPEELDKRIARLTRRERQVMALLGRGYANREIAEALGLREGTIRIYVHRVIRQLGLRNRVDVALCASRVSTDI
jgi:DNA-binding NarL/FixJ family response regulator